MMLWLPTFVEAQPKYEEEHRIKPQLVPVEAQQLVASLPLSQRVRWYLERSSSGISYEGKTRGKFPLSMEFDSLGAFQDAELRLRKRALSTLPKSMLMQPLANRFPRVKLTRVQVQYRTPDHLRSLLEDVGQMLELPHFFEVEITSREGQTRRAFEVLLDPNGKILQSRPILPVNTDILEY